MNINDDDLIREEEAAAASDAGRIGGVAGDEDDFEPEMRAVYEGGGGEAEGFEQAEADLIENAQHGEMRWTRACGEKVARQVDCE